jgi:hypothetical protein
MNEKEEKIQKIEYTKPILWKIDLLVETASGFGSEPPPPCDDCPAP